MCNNPFRSPSYSAPKVEKVADPMPTAVNTQDVDTTDDKGDRQRRRRGYAATRVADDRAVLTDNATGTGKRATLG